MSRSSQLRSRTPPAHRRRPSFRYCKTASPPSTTTWRRSRRPAARPLTTSYWFPDSAFGGGGIGLFETLEVIETIEISLYLIGVSAFARVGEDYGARLCAEAMGTEAVHRALVRFAQGELGTKDIGAPNDVGFENFDWPTVAKVRQSLEELGIRYGTESSSQPGKFYEYPGDPLASGVGTPVNHSNPA